MLSVETTPAKETRPINEMKCPFRVDDNLDFMPCCGDACMAYFEYEQTPWSLHSSSTVAPPPVVVRVCRRLGNPGPSYTCAI